MSTLEYISAFLLILSCIFIIVIVFFQGSKKGGGMSQTITGQSSDNYYQRNMGRSKEMKLKKMTVFASVIFFVVAMGVNIVAVHFAKNEEVPDEGTGFTDEAHFHTDEQGEPAPAPENDENTPNPDENENTPDPDGE